MDPGWIIATFIAIAPYWNTGASKHLIDAFFYMLPVWHTRWPSLFVPPASTMLIATRKNLSGLSLPFHERIALFLLAF